MQYENEIDQTQIHELEILIDDIKQNGLSIVTINEIPKSVTFHQIAPSWINKIFMWYEQNEISEDEVLNAVKFLTQNKIINFSHVL